MARPKVALAAYVPGSANKTGAAPLVGTRGSLIQLINIRANSIKTKATVAAVVVFIWKQQQKLTALDAAAEDQFGFGVSIYDNTAIIGTPYDVSGSAYIFTRSGTNWTQQAKLIASDGVESDNFGDSVSIYDNTAIVGATGDVSGSAYVFTRSGTNWTQQAKLIASDGVETDNFGISVSIYGDSAIIGANAEESARGAAYVFTTTGVAWTEQAKLVASDRVSGDNFGKSVSIYDNTAIVGAPDASGGAYIFTRSGSTWTQQQKLASPVNDVILFGDSVSIYGDTAIVGATYDDNDAGSQAGAAYVFTRSGSTWTQQAKLIASDAGENHYFGQSVSIYGDTAIVGASGESAYIFTRSGTTWTQQQKLTASDAGGDYFGNSVSIYGNSAIVGAYGDDGLTGSAYVFNYTSQ